MSSIPSVSALSGNNASPHGPIEESLMKRLYKSGAAPEGSAVMTTQTVGLLGWTGQALLQRLDFERGPLPRMHLALMSLALQSGHVISVLPQIVYDGGDGGLDEGQWEVR